jgi:hypothetical protein
VPVLDGLTHTLQQPLSAADPASAHGERAHVKVILGQPDGRTR